MKIKLGLPSDKVEEPQQTLMVKNFPISTLVLVTLLLASCAENDREPTTKTMEYLTVSGICREDHATQYAKYSGFLVHSLDKKTGKEHRYGWVTTELKSVDEMLKDIKRPYKYEPPFSIAIYAISEKQFSQPSMTLHGVSEHSSTDGTDDTALKFEATCQLSVSERLDHHPSNRKAQGG